MRTPSGLGGRHHSTCTGRGRRQRFLAIDRFACGDSGQGHFLVEVIRGGDVDEIDSRVGDKGPPIAGRPTKPKIQGCLCRRAVIDVGQDLEARWLEPKYRRSRPVGQGMDLADESAPNQPDPDTHRRTPYFGTGPLVDPTTRAGGMTM